MKPLLAKQIVNLLPQDGPFSALFVDFIFLTSFFDTIKFIDSQKQERKSKNQSRSSFFKSPTHSENRSTAFLGR